MGAPANVINGCGEQRGLRGATAEVAKEAGREGGVEAEGQGKLPPCAPYAPSGLPIDVRRQCCGCFPIDQFSNEPWIIKTLQSSRCTDTHKHTHDVTEGGRGGGGLRHVRVFA